MAADDFGRLFTTPEQRRALDAVRYQKETVQVEIPDEQEMAGGEDTAREPVAPIRLRGLVYRKDGRSAAWINDASTLKGDLSLEDIQVDIRKTYPVTGYRSGCPWKTGPLNSGSATSICRQAVRRLSCPPDNHAERYTLTFVDRSRNPHTDPGRHHGDSHHVDPGGRVLLHAGQEIQRQRAKSPG
ncbi:MAG: hypothetical protein U5P41_00780 [Gammaproteobacteria bacterium]|nr:hypothetical protein [Gammaproteobacteria bacterium]